MFILDYFLSIPFKLCFLGETRDQRRNNNNFFAGDLFAVSVVGCLLGYSSCLVVWIPLFLDPSDGVFGRFDLAALCGCRTLNFCLFVCLTGVQEANHPACNGLICIPALLLSRLKTHVSCSGHAANQFMSVNILGMLSMTRLTETSPGNTSVHVKMYPHFQPGLCLDECCGHN